MEAEEQVDTGTRVFPNPVENMITVEFISTGSPVTIDVIDLQGRRVKQIYEGIPASGKQRMQCNTESMPAGQYFIQLRSHAKRETKSIIKLR